MKIRIVSAGKPALQFAKSGLEDYRQRLGRLAKVEMVVVRAGTSDETSERLWKQSDGCYRIAMDERGDMLNTREWEQRLSALEMRGDIKTVAFLIGAADGHTEGMRRACDEIWGLSKLTLQHELALLVLMEQLYRVAMIQSGSPYHRE